MVAVWSLVWFMRWRPHQEYLVADGRWYICYPINTVSAMMVRLWEVSHCGIILKSSTNPDDESTCFVKINHSCVSNENSIRVWYQQSCWWDIPHRVRCILNQFHLTRHFFFLSKEPMFEASCSIWYTAPVGLEYREGKTFPRLLQRLHDQTRGAIDDLTLHRRPVPNIRHCVPPRKRCFPCRNMWNSNMHPPLWGPTLC